MTSMRAVIAKRLCQSKSTSPHGYATLECNVDNLNRIRADFANAGKVLAEHGGRTTHTLALAS